MRIFVDDAYGGSIPLTAHPWDLIKSLKDTLSLQLSIPSHRQRLFFAGHECRNKHTLNDIDCKTGDHIFLVITTIALGLESSTSSLPHSYSQLSFTTSSIQRTISHSISHHGALTQQQQQPHGTPIISYIVSVYGNVPCPPQLLEIVKQVRQGLDLGLVPKLSEEGTGGTYFMRDRRKRNVAVFKPEDEEPFTPHNPKSYVGSMGQQGFRPGVLSGEGSLREVAAYLLDHDHFASVPMTTRCEITSSVFPTTSSSSSHTLQSGFHALNLSTFSSSLDQSTSHTHIPSPTTTTTTTTTTSSLKIGSFQEFVESDDMAGNYSCSLFPVKEVQKIAILDIRLVNLDRNDANILVKRSFPTTPTSTSTSISTSTSTSRTRTSSKPQPIITLIPIDHSYSLPDTLEIGFCDWIWLDWPQCKLPLDTTTRTYIASLDIDAEIHMLRQTLAIREPCLRIFKITNRLLQKGVAAGLTLYDIGSLITRRDLDEPSELETICAQATVLARSMRANMRRSPSITPAISSRHPAPPTSLLDPAHISTSPSLSSPSPPTSELLMRRTVSLHEMNMCKDKRGFESKQIVQRQMRREREEKEEKHKGKNGRISHEFDSPPLASRRFTSHPSRIHLFFHALDRIYDNTIDILLTIQRQHEKKQKQRERRTSWKRGESSETGTATATTADEMSVQHKDGNNATGDDHDERKEVTEPHVIPSTQPLVNVEHSADLPKRSSLVVDTTNTDKRHLASHLSSPSPTPDVTPMSSLSPSPSASSTPVRSPTSSSETSRSPHSVFSPPSVKSPDATSSPSRPASR